MNRSDTERLQEILALSLAGLEEDLDDLRDELAEELQRYEGALDDAAAALPEWLEVAPAEIKAQFAFDDEVCGRGILGPRAVALGAARVEAFIHRWIGNGDDILEIDFEEPENVNALQTDAHDIDNLLNALESLAREIALDADSRLGSWLDDILAELDEKREEDEAALNQLVGDGTLTRGKEARVEIAELWEEQRGRVAELREVWGGIEQLVFEGVDLTVSGVTELKSLRRRAMDGLAAANATLDGDEAETPQKVTVDEVPDTDIDGLGGEASAPSLRIVARERHTAKIDISSPTQPYVKDADAEGPEGVGRAEGSGSPADEDAEDDPSDAATEKMRIVSATSRKAPAEKAGSPAAHANSAPEAGGESSDAEDDEHHQETRLDGKINRGDAVRIVTGWRSVQPAEVFFILGLPALFLLPLAGLSALRLAGNTNVIDPFYAWPLIFPWGFVAAVAWMVLGALFRAWRPIFDGPKMSLVRWTDVEEVEEIVVSEDVLRVGRLRFSWASVHARVRRWESPTDGTFGWLVGLKPRGAGEIELKTPERNFALWEASGHPMTKPSADAWDVSPMILEKIREHCG